MQGNTKRPSRFIARVAFVDSLGWCAFITADSQRTESGRDRKRFLPRRYWMVDWNQFRPITAGLYWVMTGDFTERYHEDWARPYQKIKERYE